MESLCCQVARRMQQLHKGSGTETQPASHEAAALDAKGYRLLCLFQSNLFVFMLHRIAATVVGAHSLSQRGVSRNPECALRDENQANLLHFRAFFLCWLNILWNYMQYPQSCPGFQAWFLVRLSNMLHMILAHLAPPLHISELWPLLYFEYEGVMIT